MKREKNISRKVALNLWLPIIVVVFILVAALGVIEVNPGLGYTILVCLLYTSPSPRDAVVSRMPSSA